MKRIANSTKLFALFGLVVIIIIMWQVVLTNRIFHDVRGWREAKSIEALKIMLERDAKTYQKMNVGAFSKIVGKNGVCVCIMKSDCYGVYRSNFDRARITVSEEAGVLYISDNVSHIKSLQTPVFVLTPNEPEVCFTDGSMSNAALFGFDGFQTKISLEVTNVALRTNLKHLNIEVCDGFLDLETGSRYFAVPTETVDVKIRAERSELRLSDRLCRKVNIQMDLEQSIFSVFVHKDAHIGSIKLNGSLATNSMPERYRKDQINLATLHSQAVCDSLLIHLQTPDDKRYEVILEQIKAGFEDIHIEGKTDLIRK